VSRDLPPTGDKRQQYEIRLDTGDGGLVIGYTSLLMLAERIAERAELQHRRPGAASIYDRWNRKPVQPSAAKKG
jgi:hypothetical protein